MKRPRILLRSSGSRPIIVADAGVSIRAAASEDPGDAMTEAFRALGYRQTKLNAAQGGKPNHNCFRFRNEGMRALARSFRGKTFIGGHDWGDPRARGGDIVDAWAEDIEKDLELGIFFDIVAKAPWALEGLKNGTIDRFSFGVIPNGEITCTIHEEPVWSSEECWCWPGKEVDGKTCEFEFEDGEGVELSAVNVPAVDGTGIVEVSGANRPSDEEIAAFVALCGRTHPRLQGGARVGGFSAAPVPITMAVKDDEPRGALMDRALLCKQLGLPATATDEEILAKINANALAAAQASVLQTQLAEVSNREQTLAQERDAAHVESEITRLRASRAVSDQVVEKLRASAKTSRAAFDASLALVESSAPELVAAATGGAPTTARPVLQSDSKPTPNPGAPTDSLEDGPDAFEANRTNPNLGRFMKQAGISAEDVRKHGSRTFHVLPNLRELADATAARS